MGIRPSEGRGEARSVGGSAVRSVHAFPRRPLHSFPTTIVVALKHVIESRVKDPVAALLLTSSFPWHTNEALV